MSRGDSASRIGGETLQANSLVGKSLGKFAPGDWGPGLDRESQGDKKKKEGKKGQRDGGASKKIPLPSASSAIDHITEIESV